MLSNYFNYIRSNITMFYSNWRIGPTLEEKHSYNISGKILLTFDDYADSKIIKNILNILKGEDVKAIFFIIGDYANKNPEIINEIKEAGHWIGNHTKSHKNLLKISEKEVREEILGGPSSNLLRPPYGAYNKNIRRIAKEMGYKVCFWDIDSEDWKGIKPEQIKTRILRSLRPNACILMHLNGKYTVEALPDILVKIKLKGFKICDSVADIII